MTQSKLIAIFILATVVVGSLYTNCAKVDFASLASSDLKALGTIRMVINDDSPFTNQTIVQLSFLGFGSSTERAKTEIYVTDDPQCEQGGFWEPLVERKSWTLKEENKSTKVFVKYRVQTAEKIVQETDCQFDDIINDNQPPIVEVNAPPGLSNLQEIDFALNITDNLSGISEAICSIASKKMNEECTEKMLLRTFPDGANGLTIKVRDGAGNETVVQKNWEIDREKPTIRPISFPPVTTAKPTEAFTFTMSDNRPGPLHAFCSIDGGAPQSCESPFAPSLPQGLHVVSIVARDEAGNESAPWGLQWTINFKTPTVEITKGPQALTNSGTAVFEFRAVPDGEPISAFECQFDNGAFSACSSPLTKTSLVEGGHKFSVRGKSALGVFSATALYQWTIDTILPTLSFDNMLERPDYTNQATTRFGFVASDAGSGIARIECQINGASPVVCASLWSATAPAEGDYQLVAQAIDKANNRSTPLTHRWIFDQTAPGLAWKTTPGKISKSPEAVFNFIVTDTSPVESVLCKLDNATATRCQRNSDGTYSVSYSNLALGEHTLSVELLDRAKNKSTFKYQWLVEIQAVTCTESAELVLPAGKDVYEIPPRNGGKCSYIKFASRISEGPSRKVNFDKEVISRYHDTNGFNNNRNSNPSVMASKQIKFKLSGLRPLVLAGNTTGNENIKVDNFVLYGTYPAVLFNPPVMYYSAAGTEDAAIVGVPNTILLREQSVSLKVKALAGTASLSPIDITGDAVSAGEVFILDVRALDCGGRQELSDIFLVFK